VNKLEEYYRNTIPDYVTNKCRFTSTLRPDRWPSSGTYLH